MQSTNAAVRLAREIGIGVVHLLLHQHFSELC
jgi:hypothetical protein